MKVEISISVFCTALVKLQEFAEVENVSLLELCSWLSTGCALQGTQMYDAEYLPSFVCRIRNSLPFIDFDLEDEKLVYDICSIFSK